MKSSCYEREEAMNGWACDTSSNWEGGFMAKEEAGVSGAAAAEGWSGAALLNISEIPHITFSTSLLISGCLFIFTCTDVLTFLPRENSWNHRPRETHATCAGTEPDTWPERNTSLEEEGRGGMHFSLCVLQFMRSRVSLSNHLNISCHHTSPSS